MPSVELHKRNIVVIGGSYAGKYNMFYASRDSIHTGTKAIELVAARMYLTHHTILIEPHSRFYHLYVLPCYPVVHGFEHRVIHPRLHKLISSRAEELRVKVVLDERVQVPEDGFPIDSTKFDADLLSGRSLRTDLVVRAFVASFASTLTSTHKSVLPATCLYLHHCAHSHQSALHQIVSSPCSPLSNSLTLHIQQYL